MPRTRSALLSKHTEASYSGGKQRSQIIDIPELKAAYIMLEVEGITPLITHNFGRKSKQQMLDKQLGKARMRKLPKDPDQEYQDSLYPMGRNRYGVPASAFKKAMVSACRFADGIKMTFAKGAFHVEGELLEILKKRPHPREDVVRLNSGPSPVADLRYRAEFDAGWKVRVPVLYNPNAITPGSIVNLLNIAGSAIGICEWRPEKNGNFGRFRVCHGASLKSRAA